MRTVVIVTASMIAILLAPAASAAPLSPNCDEANLQTIGDLDAALSRKAVEIIRLSLDDSGEPRLRQLVDPKATFSLGAGDVGDPLGTYVSGARALSRKMSADAYRFAVWSSIPTPIQDACSPRTVEVEFIDTGHSYSFPVKFTFSNGRLLKAEGWTNLFQSGLVGRAGSR